MNYTESVQIFKDYETNILGCVMQDERLIERIRWLEPEDFYDKRHQLIFSTMLQMKNKHIPVGPLELLEHLQKEGLIKEAGEWLYLSGLKELAISPANIEYEAKQIKRESQKRQLKEKGQRLIQAIDRGAEQEIESLQREIFTETLEKRPTLSQEIPWPAPLADAAFYGLAGEIVRAIEPHSEADPVALLMNFLTAFGNMIGDKPHLQIEADKHPMRLFVVLVGDTSKARKGTSWGYLKSIFGTLDPEWSERIKTGLSSGEGLIWAVRDEIKRRDPIKEKGRVVGYEELVVDEGIRDKRLLIVEGEFASTLRVLGREGNILSAIIRNAWDNGDLQVLTKNSPAKATGAHISIIGHITRQELIRYLSDTEAANGFGNRFLWFCVKRSKSLPFGSGFSKINWEPFLKKLKQATLFMLNMLNMQPLTWAEETRPLWAEVYPALSEGKAGLFGALTARAEAYVTRLACIYALLDLSEVIKPEHLMAALAIWEYVENSIRYVFQDTTGDPLANEILEALANKTEGMTRTEIYQFFNFHKNSDRIGEALETLSSLGRIRKEVIPTAGRSREVWIFNAQKG